MPRRANKTRPRTVLIRLSLWPGRDDDLIALFDQAPRRGKAAIVRQYLRGRAAIQTPDEPPADETVDLTGLLFG